MSCQLKIELFEFLLLVLCILSHTHCTHSHTRTRTCIRVAVRHIKVLQVRALLAIIARDFRISA